MSIATIECLKQTWVADKVDGDGRRHREIAAGAHSKRTPFCRQHERSTHKIRSVFPPIYDSVSSFYDLSSDSDILVVRHEIEDSDPFEELEELAELGRKIILESGLVVPDFGHLDRANIVGPERHGYNTRSDLTPSEIDDLAIARRLFTRTVLARHND